MTPRLSVVVCTHNRAGILGRCLDSLLAQTLPPGRFEILVVDNASRDDTRSVVRHGRRAARVRYLFEPRLGLSRARNTGWREARAPLVAYLDDDAVAAPDWAAAALRAFQRWPDAACVGGRVDPLWPGPRPAWLDHRLMGVLSVVHWSPWARELDPKEWLVGANVCLRRSLLEEVGGFPEYLGRKGASLMSGEEAAVIKALRVRGHRVFYDPDMRVQHRIDPERLKARWFLRRYFCHGVSVGLAELKNTPITPAGRLLEAYRALGACLRQAREAFVRRRLAVRDPNGMLALCNILNRAGRAWVLLKGAGGPA